MKARNALDIVRRATGVALLFALVASLQASADYCGDGTPHTRDGTPVDVYNTVGIQSPEPGSGLSFEAGWRADGAVCVRKVRIPEITTLEALVQSCPARLQKHVGPECTEERARQLGTLVMNRS